MKRGQRQNNKSHYLINRGAIEQAAHQRVFYQEPQLAAGRVVNRRDREGDKEVQENSENVRSGATIMQSSLPQQPRGNYERNLFSKQDDGLSNVQSPGNQTANCDCQECVPLPRLHYIGRSKAAIILARD